MAGTWTLSCRAINFNTSKHLLSLENPSGSGKIAKIYKIYAQNSAGIALTGTQLQLEMRKLVTLTSVSAGIAITPQAYKSDNVALGTVTGYTNRTYTTIGTNSLMRRIPWSSDEANQTTASTDELELFLPYNVWWDSSYTDANCQPIVLNANEAFTIQQLTTSTVGFIDIAMEITVE